MRVSAAEYQPGPDAGPKSNAGPYDASEKTSSQVGGPNATTIWSTWMRRTSVFNCSSHEAVILLPEPTDVT